MWDEYADGGRGFQLEYRRDDLLGIGLVELAIPTVFPVMYERERPKMSDFAMALVVLGLDPLLQLGADPLRVFAHVSALKALYIKDAERFSHEEEWRVIMPNPTINEGRSLFAVRKCPCRRIRLGESITGPNEEAIREIAGRLGVPVVCFDEG